MNKISFIISTPPVDADGEDVDIGLTEVESRSSIVADTQHGERIDRALALMVPEFSRSYLQQLIELHLVKINGNLVLKPAGKVKCGDEIVIELRPTPQSMAFKPEAIPLDVVFEDAHLLVINKPAGLVVHPAPGNWSGTLLNALLAHDPKSALMPRAGIVHRLDKDTSGLMVVARTRQAMDALVSAIAAREVSRQYLAIGQRRWNHQPQISVDAAIGRDPRNRLKMAVVDLLQHSGKTARTDIVLLKSGSDCCLVRCVLHTGRTHQIRVHMSHVGHTLVGDRVYGGEPRGAMNRQALHAVKLAFKHPVEGNLLAFESALPSDFLELSSELGLSYNADRTL